MLFKPDSQLSKVMDYYICYYNPIEYAICWTPSGNYYYDKMSLIL